MVNYNKEGTTSKKHAHYTLIAIIQLAAEAKADADPMTEQLNKMAKLQYMMARKLMKQAFDAPEVRPCNLGLHPAIGHSTNASLGRSYRSQKYSGSPIHGVSIWPPRRMR